MKDIYFLLENGMVFQGKSFGAENEGMGETVFTTAMTGYVEALTDPGFYGQIVVQTFPLIGNYGIMNTDFESEKPHLKAYIVREFCEEPSNFRCETDLSSFLKANDITGLCGIDTRQLTKVIRDEGIMNGLITFKNPYDNKEQLLYELQNYKLRNDVSCVTSSHIKEYTPQNIKHKIAMIDLGVKQSVIDALVKRDCYVMTFPSSTTAERIDEFGPDGIMLSNGPGNPEDNMEIANEIKNLIKKKYPIFGIGLGHQLLAIANGAKTEKLKYGHRGANHPVRNVDTGKVFITSQNTGYAVISDSVSEKTGKIIYVNVNAETCEGIEYKGIPAFGVQFFPDTGFGHIGTGFVYDKFLAMLN